MLIDGNSLAYRAFYALPPLNTKDGIPTNAVYGFTNMLLKVLEQEKPDKVIVAFDAGRLTFRNEQFEEYKSQRKPSPPEFRSQLPLVKEILDALKIKVCELSNYEADDLIGTLAKKAEREGMEVIIVTGDRDMLQLISPKINVLLTKKGISEMELFDLQKVKDKYGVEPCRLIDIKGLTGDVSDNIPGVPGIGEKTALKLIHEFGNLENVFRNLEKIKSRSISQKLSEFKAQALLSKDLATIKTDVDLELDLREAAYIGPDRNKLLNTLQKLEFNTLIDRFFSKREIKKLPEENTINNDNYRNIEISQIESIQEELNKSDMFSLYLLLDGENYHRASFKALGICWDGKSSSIPRWNAEIAAFLKRVLENNSKILWFDAKSAMVWLEKRGIELQQTHSDCLLAAYLLDSSCSPKLSDLGRKYLSEFITQDLEPEVLAANYAEIVLKLTPLLEQKIAEEELDKLYYEIELPLESVLADMELKGLKIDLNQLEAIDKDLEKRIESLTEEIYELAGEKFNINSPKQLSVILFEKLKLPTLKKTKTGYSTDAEVLEKLAQEHQIVSKILDYRFLTKLKFTYVDGLRPLIDPSTHKVHTIFNQTGTATGRLSSAEPNLQNIPVRLEEAKKIRKIFIPEDVSHLFLAADYSQIELRILAHLSQDENLIAIFQRGEDIHTRTAAEIFGVELENVTSEMRRRAKVVNFGIIYGMSDYGLAQDLQIERKEAKEYIERYFERFPKVKIYLEERIKEAEEKGFVTTIMKRRRYFPEIKNSNHNRRSFAQRAAMNAPLQGSAADLIKVAMLEVWRDLKKENLLGKIVLQVHDELILEVPESEILTTAGILKKDMENAFKLSVPLVVELKAGFSWYDLEPLKIY